MTAAQVQLLELALADDAKSWSRHGFAVDGDRCSVGQVDLVFRGRGAGRRITGWTLAGLSSTELDGLPTKSGPPRPSREPGVHPNGVTNIDHVVAVSPDLDRTVAALSGAGLDLRRLREEPTPAGAPRQAFFRLGEVILEVIAEPAEVADRYDDGERPAFFWGLALAVPDIAAAAPSFGDHLGVAHPAVQPRRTIATVRRSAELCLPVALITPEAA